ncbi:MAG: TlyA family RNA methyltransferase [Alphaproteobacteria bacterium]|nr:TlyA family RNA methyltransferase [Alphaproteobacteria bacterium]
MRLDVHLVQQNLYPTRAKAAAAIDLGLVFINGIARKKPSQIIKQSDKVKVIYLPYKSGRGSLKLIHALDYFGVNPAGLACLDVGASTGGFTEVLLNRGAAKVFAVEVGTGQMISELKNNPRVVSLENTDIRALLPIAPIDLAVIDVSFISLSNIAQNVANWHPAHIIALIKPQFEVPRAVAAKHNGVIKSEKDRETSIKKAVESFTRLGYEHIGTIESPVKGGSGNIEYLAMFKLLCKCK